MQSEFEKSWISNRICNGTTCIRIGLIEGEIKERESLNVTQQIGSVSYIFLFYIHKHSFVKNVLIL